MGKTPDVMRSEELVPDGGGNPAISRSGDVVCFGFLTYCLLLMVDELPPKNGGALVRGSVDTVGDDAAIVASVLTNWRVPTRLISSPVGNDHYGETGNRTFEFVGSGRGASGQAGVDYTG